MYWKTKGYESKDGASIGQFAYQVADFCEDSDYPIPPASELECFKNGGFVDANPGEINYFDSELEEWFEHFRKARADDKAYREECRGLMRDRTKRTYA